MEKNPTEFLICIMGQNRRLFLQRLITGTAASALALHGIGKGFPEITPALDINGLEGEDKWEAIRLQFDLPEKMAWFNTGTLGLMPIPVLNAVQASLLLLQKGSYNMPKAVRTSVAKLMGAAETEIALTRNTTEGINIVAQGLKLKHGDEIILSTQEHAGNAVPWLARAQRDKLRIRVLEPGPDQVSTMARLATLVTRKTKVIALPHITCTTGQVLPVKEIVAQYQSKVPYIFFDGAHSPGSTMLDMPSLGCGFYATCGHKWLCGPAGTGFLYIREDLLDAIEPIFTGAGSDNGWELDTHTQAIKGWAPHAARFEIGTHNRSLFEGMHAAIEFQNEIGTSDIHARVRELSRRLRDGIERLDWLEILTPKEEASAAGILSFRTKDPNRRLSLIKAIQAAGLFRIREVRESGLDCVRISTHFFNSPKEVDDLAKWIQEWRD